MQTVLEDNPQSAVLELQERQESLLRWLGNVQVTNDTEQKGAEDMLISARFALKQANEKRMELTRPLDESKAKIMALFKPYTDKLNSGIAALNAALTNYHEKKRIDAEAARLTALAEEAARIAEARDTGEILEPLSQPVIESVAKTSRANMGSVTYREDYDIQVINPNLVPRDLCEPSMAKIRMRAKSGVTNIPGVLISRKYISSTRQGGK